MGGQQKVFLQMECARRQEASGGDWRLRHVAVDGFMGGGRGESKCVGDEGWRGKKTPRKVG